MRPGRRVPAASSSKAGEIDLGDVTIRSGNDYATVYVVSLDDQPVAHVGEDPGADGHVGPANGLEDEAGRVQGRRQEDVKGYEIVATGKPPWRIVDTDVTLVDRQPEHQDGDPARHVRLSGEEGRGRAAGASSPSSYRRMRPDVVLAQNAQ